MSKKKNTCPLSLDNICVPTAHSCGAVDVRTCRHLFRAYSLGYRKATEKATAEAKERHEETPEILNKKVNITANLDACPEIETNPVPMSTANTTFKQT